MLEKQKHWIGTGDTVKVVEPVLRTTTFWAHEDFDCEDEPARFTDTEDKLDPRINWRNPFVVTPDKRNGGVYVVPKIGVLGRAISRLLKRKPIEPVFTSRSNLKLVRRSRTHGQS